MRQKGIHVKYLEVGAYFEKSSILFPVENKQLLEKEYAYCGENEGVLNGKKDMQTTWEDCLNNKEKYKLYSPERLLQPIVGLPQYELLIDYLRKRYW